MLYNTYIITKYYLCTIFIYPKLEKIMFEKVGNNAGAVWQVLSAANEAVNGKDLKKATKLTEKDMYAALGWLLREGKINVVEEGKELLINLI